jgi:hypothetical protein
VRYGWIPPSNGPRFVTVQLKQSGQGASRRFGRVPRLLFGIGANLSIANLGGPFQSVAPHSTIATPTRPRTVSRGDLGGIEPSKGAHAFDQSNLDAPHAVDFEDRFCWGRAPGRASTGLRPRRQYRGQGLRLRA